MAILLSYLTVYFIVVVSSEKGDDFFIILFVTFDQVIQRGKAELQCFLRKYFAKVDFCVKSVRIWSFFGSNSPICGLNMDQESDEYRHFLRSDRVAM